MIKKVILFIVLISIVLTSISSMPIIGYANNDTQINDIISKMSLRQKFGQMLLCDFRSWGNNNGKVTPMTVLSKEVEQIIKDYHIGNVILFGNNFTDTEQTVRLTDALQNCCEIPMFISVDQEGGEISRLTEGTNMVGNMAVGASFSEDYAYQTGKIIGDELMALGVNLNFAPVMDVNNNPLNPVINLRSFSSDFNHTALMGCAMISGYDDSGIISCVKHFPGHGNTSVDSHYGLPIVYGDYEKLKQEELKPFQSAINSGIDMVMTTHIQFPDIDNTKITADTGEMIIPPATLSKTILTDILQGEMGFNGVIVTDALQMGAITDYFGPESTVKYAINAGANLLTMPVIFTNKNGVNKLENLYSYIEEQIEKGEITIEQIDNSVAKILQLKYKYGLMNAVEKSLDEKIDYAKSVVGCEKHKEIEREIAANAAVIAKNDNALPIKPSINDTALFIASSSNLINSFNFCVDRLINEGKITSFNKDSYDYSQDNGISSDLKEKINNADFIIITTKVSGDLSVSNKNIKIPVDIIDYAKSFNKTSIIISTYFPYDIGIYTKADAILAVFGQKGITDNVNSYLMNNNYKTTFAFGANVIGGLENIFGAAKTTGMLPVQVPNVKSDGSFNGTAYDFGYRDSSVELPEQISESDYFTESDSESVFNSESESGAENYTTEENITVEVTIINDGNNSDKAEQEIDAITKIYIIIASVLLLTIILLVALYFINNRRKLTK